VIMISRPKLPERLRVESVTDVMQWLSHRTCLGA
jgi:precorrin-6A/cobalt-precorrin-6A reductase